MTSWAALCSFVACGPLVTYMATTMKEREDSVSSVDLEFESFEAERELYRSKKRILRTDSEYSLGLNVHEHYVVDEMMHFGLCDTGHYVIGVMKAVAYISAVAAAYSMHRSLGTRNFRK